MNIYLFVYKTFFPVPKDKELNCVFDVQRFWKMKEEKNSRKHFSLTLSYISMYMQNFNVYKICLTFKDCVRVQVYIKNK